MNGVQQCMKRKITLRLVSAMEMLTKVMQLILSKVLYGACMGLWSNGKLLPAPHDCDDFRFQPNEYIQSTSVYRRILCFQ